MKKEDKKGSTNEVWMVIALVVLVIALVFIFRAEGWAGDIFNQVPKNKEAIAQGCSLAASGQLKETYCNQIRKYNKNEYITCDYAKKYGIVIEGDNIDEMNTYCGTLNRNVAFKKECESEELKDNSNIKINGESCGDWIKREDKSSSSSSSDYTTAYV